MLEDVCINFSGEIEENFSDFSKNEEKNLEIVKNRLDITEFLWQNILVEIPLKVVRKKRWYDFKGRWKASYYGRRVRKREK